MLSNETIHFLQSLKRNNNREWFQNNKNLYEASRAEFEIFVSLLLQGLQKFDNELLSLNAKKCIFRIYRDVRFSRDKSPYKANLGAYFVKGGKKSGFAGYYIHIEPGNSFAAGGIHMPPAHVLRQIRSEIFNHMDEFKSIINNPEFVSLFGSLEGEKLKGSPSGFSKDFPDIELLKFKSYTVFSPLSDHQITQRGFLTELIPTYKMMLPFNTFLNGAIRQ